MILLRCLASPLGGITVETLGLQELLVLELLVLHRQRGQSQRDFRFLDFVIQFFTLEPHYILSRIHGGPVWDNLFEGKCSDLFGVCRNLFRVDGFYHTSDFDRARLGITGRFRLILSPQLQRSHEKNRGDEPSKHEIELEATHRNQTWWKYMEMEIAETVALILIRPEMPLGRRTEESADRKP